MITACVWIPIGNHENHDYCYRLENSKCASQSSCLIQRHVRSCEYLSCRFLQTETYKTMAPSQKICGDTVQPKIAISAAQMLHARPSESALRLLRNTSRHCRSCCLRSATVTSIYNTPFMDAGFLGIVLNSHYFRACRMSSFAFQGTYFAAFIQSS